MVGGRVDRKLTTSAGTTGSSVASAASSLLSNRSTSLASAVFCPCQSARFCPSVEVRSVIVRRRVLLVVELELLLLLLLRELLPENPSERRDDGIEPPLLRRVVLEYCVCPVENENAMVVVEISVRCSCLRTKTILNASQDIFIYR
jgi:hypothetical protein